MQLQVEAIKKIEETKVDLKNLDNKIKETEIEKDKNTEDYTKSDYLIESKHKQ